jgi:predicted helicase
MSVVFSTYHSIDVISKAQKKHKLREFDLIICDEAHRTTGATFDDESESHFVKIHDANFIQGKKRIYMTATPRIYADTAKVTAEKDNVALCSMDDEKLYGKNLHLVTFSEAVRRGLLVDYKVLVLTIDEAHISKRLQDMLKDENNQLKVDDAAKIIGCWKALSKQDQEGILADDSDPMQKALAFCQVIEAQQGGRTHKVSSKNIASMFQAVVEAYQKQEDDHDTLKCEAKHVDGSMNASEKEEKLNWLKAKTEKETCRILSNVRCLSEGVDVPALDAVLFLTPRNSQVDVVQAVGRVMRNAPNKKLGYVILPVVIPMGMTPSKALDDNKIYKVVWEVLQALRSHDDRFDAMINKLDLIGKDNRKMEVIAITDRIKKKPTKEKGSKNKETGKDGYTIGTPERGSAATDGELKFEVGDVERALYAKVVKKCGNRRHWEEWANDISKIANTHITRITTIVNNPENKKESKAFKAFADELRDDLNDSITDGEVIEMLAQHLITKPVFEALFEEYSFASNNPVSQAMQKVLNVLHKHRLEKEADTLERFYASVKLRAEGIDSAEGKQKIIVELYDKFFRNAFPKMTERLGIVYTPVEVVDFIIHSVNDLLQKEFGKSLGNKGVHIVDPFTGTGTFITRLLQSGLISKKQLPHKFKNEIHANEIVLLAYYIAAINIEAVYHSLVGGEHQPFEGICLTDTFQLYEKDDLISKLLVDNSDRRIKQKKLDIRVIMGNPPYSAGQASANDNNANVAYEGLDSRIRDTYAKFSKMTSVKNLYDSYIRSIRWASDRIGDKGVVGFVTNAGFIDTISSDGLRKCLAEEFSSIYIFHLRGNQRTAGELSRREGGKIFGSGSRAPIAISLLVKNPNIGKQGKIYLHDIGDYLSRDEKLTKVSEFKSVEGIAKKSWLKIVPDKHNDWVNQRDDSFDKFMKLGEKKVKGEVIIFNNYSQGVLTSRDAWCYSFSKSRLIRNMKSTIEFYNAEVVRHVSAKPKSLKGFISNDSLKIAWSSSLLPKVEKHIKSSFNRGSVMRGSYRPFQKQWIYFDGMFNHRVSQMSQIFPEMESENLVICLTGLGETREFTALLSDVLPNFHFVAGSQCFPLRLYETRSDNKKAKGEQSDLFASKPGKTVGNYTVKDGITDAGLEHFKKAYPKAKISKEDIFYYIYGLLHSTEYRERYADNLTKELPRIPCVKTVKDFWSFSKAGRKLADLHINYETVEPYPVKIDAGGKVLAKKDFRVTKMKFEKTGEKSAVIYNPHITIRKIPLEAYEYIVNGKSALEWVMERQGVTTDRDSGIVNDANLWATETMKNAKYPLELFQRVITVSTKTMKIVKSLPPLDIES